MTKKTETKTKNTSTKIHVAKLSGAKSVPTLPVLRHQTLSFVELGHAHEAALASHGWTAEDTRAIQLGLDLAEQAVSAQALQLGHAKAATADSSRLVAEGLLFREQLAKALKVVGQQRATGIDPKLLKVSKTPRTGLGLVGSDR